MRPRVDPSGGPMKCARMKAADFRITPVEDWPEPRLAGRGCVVNEPWPV